MSKFITLHSRSHCAPSGDSRISINVDRIAYFKDAQHQAARYTDIVFFSAKEEDLDEPWHVLVDEPYDVVAKMIGGAA